MQKPIKDDQEQKEGGTSVSAAMLTVGDGILGAALLVILGVYGGDFLDRKFGITPWMTILLPVVGAGLGLYRFVIKAISLDKDR